MTNSSINKKKDKMFKFNLPEHGFVVEAKNAQDAVEKAEIILSKK